LGQQGERPPDSPHYFDREAGRNSWDVASRSGGGSGRGSLDSRSKRTVGLYNVSDDAEDTAGGADCVSARKERV
jgi:hypothetical protein